MIFVTWCNLSNYPVIHLNILLSCPPFVLQSQPLFELRCSNNVVHLHTCADSCAALVNMLQYLVSQGDLHPPPRHASPTEIAGQKLPVRWTYSPESWNNEPEKSMLFDTVFLTQGVVNAVMLQKCWQEQNCVMLEERYEDAIELSNVCVIFCLVSCQKVLRLCCPALQLKPLRSTSTTWLMP